MKNNLKQKSQQFQDFYHQWKQALTGEHKSIWTRGVTAWQDYVYYRCVSHAFSEALKTPAKNELPHGLMNTYHNAFYKSLMMDLRSAIGGNNDDLSDPKKGEYSIRAVLRSIAATTITRADLFDLNGIDYEYESKRTKDEEEIRKAFETPRFGIIHSNYGGWKFSEKLHLTVDRLTGKNAQSRSANDVIPSQLFLDAETALRTRTDKLVFFVNKHIAHAATKESTEAESPTVPSRINTEDLEETFGALIGTFDMLASDLFCWADYSFNLDVSSKLEGVEKAFGLENGTANLNKTYRELTEKFDLKLRKWRPI